MKTFDQIKNNPVNRRAFLQRMGAAGLGVAAIALLDGCGGGNDGPINGGGTPTTGSFPVKLPGRNTNEQVLNFALTLEILEADLYRQALNLAVGRPLTDPLQSSPDAYAAPRIAAGNVTSGAAAFAYLRDFAFVEAAHRDFLTAALQNSGAPVVQRNPKGYTFGPLAPPANPTLADLLTSIYPLEEEGVSAYLGAAPLLTDLGLLQTAASIYSTEARHSAAIAYILRKDTGPAQSPANGVGERQKVQLGGNTLPYSGPNNESDKQNVFEYVIPPTTVVQNIQPLIVQ